MEVRVGLPLPVDASQIVKGQVFLVFEPGRTLTCMKIDAGHDQPDLALVLYASTPTCVESEDETFHLVDMNLLTQRFGRLDGALSLDVAGDIRQLSVVSHPGRGTLIVDAGSPSIVALRNGRLERCCLDGALRRGPMHGLQYSNWRLALLVENELGERARIEIATGVAAP